MVDMVTETVLLDVESCEPNQWNPNQMDADELNLLAKKIQEVGFVDPIQVVRMEEDTFKIIGGEHRWRAMRALGEEKIPANVIELEQWTEDVQKAESISLNVLHGRLDPQKFYELYEDMAERYTDEVMQQMMGFAKDAEFRKLVEDVVNKLPPHLRKAAQKAKEEIRTIDDLSNLLNRLFTEHGETLPSNVMAFTYGGREVLWILADKRLWNLARGIADDVIGEGGDVAARFADLLEQAEGDQ